MSRANQCYAQLNEKGIALMGRIFPSGRIPLMTTKTIRIDAPGYSGDAYAADWAAFTEDQKLEFTRYVEARFSLTAEQFLTDLQAHDFVVPIREELVSGVAAPHRMLM